MPEVFCVFKICSPEEQWLQGIFSTQEKAADFCTQRQLDLDKKAAEYGLEAYETLFVEAFPVDRPGR